MSEFGLYVVPDDYAEWECKSVSKGIDWGGPHVTIAGFSKENGEKLAKIMPYLHHHLAVSKRWKPNKKAIERIHTNENKQCNLKSKTLDNLTTYLNGKVDKLKNDFHIHFQGTDDIFEKIRTTKNWSLIIIEKDTNGISWLLNTMIPLYDIHSPLE